MEKININVDSALKDALEEGQAVKVGGYFTVEHVRNGEVIDKEVSKNIVVDQGLNYILDAALSNGTAITTLYLGIFKNNYTPIAGDTASTFAGAGVANEIITEIDESTRPQWVEAGVASKTITNSASAAVFTANTTVAAYGAFLISNNTLGGTSGTLISASKFSAVKNLANTDTLNVTYTLTIADA